MTDYAPPRSSQDLNYLFPVGNHSVSNYHHPGGLYQQIYSGGSQVQYPPINSSYSTYSTPCIPSQNSPNSNNYNLSPMACNYQNAFSRTPMVPSQPRLTATTSFYSSHNNQRPQLRDSRFDAHPIHETESQESVNEDTRASEPVEPAMEGYPDVKEFDELMKRYIAGLSPKKQDKALIHARRAANIRAVLIDKKTTAVESAQFRFWVKKMFTLLPNDPKLSDKKKKICHEGKPVAVREKLYKILIKAHKQCQHGGRDKTSQQVRKIYSWVPKELISRFVKLCPTCQVRRGSARTSPPCSEHDSYIPTAQSSGINSPSRSRRGSIATRRSSMNTQSPNTIIGASSGFEPPNRWMNAIPPGQPTSNNMSSTLSATASFHSLSSSSPATVLSSLHNAQNSHGAHLNFSATLPNDSQSTYNSSNLRFAHTPPMFSYQDMKQQHQY